MSVTCDCFIEFRIQSCSHTREWDGTFVGGCLKSVHEAGGSGLMRLEEGGVLDGFLLSRG